MFKLVYWILEPVGKRAVGLRLKGLFVTHLMQIRRGGIGQISWVKILLCDKSWFRHRVQLRIDRTRRKMSKQRSSWFLVLFRFHISMDISGCHYGTFIVCNLIGRIQIKLLSYCAWNDSNYVCICSSGSSGRIEGCHLFYDLFSQGLGGAWPPRPPGSATGLHLTLLAIIGKHVWILEFLWIDFKPQENNVELPIFVPQLGKVQTSSCIN